MHDALEWPPPPEWILSPDAARLQFSIGTFVNDQRPSFVGHDLQTFLAFEDVYGPCAYPYGRELGWDFVDRVVAEAPAGSTLEGAAGRVRDRLLLDGHLADVERPWLEALAGVPSDTAAADVPDLEGALRAYCGALLLSPQYWLVTELAP